MNHQLGEICSAVWQKVRLPQSSVRACFSAVMNAFDGRPAAVSPFVAFFQSLPRYGRFTVSYFESLLIVASPFLALALGCLFFSLIGGRRRLEPNLKITSKTYGSVSTTSENLASETKSAESNIANPLSALRASLLFIISTSALALALAANWHLWDGTITTLSVARSSAAQLTKDAHGVFAVTEQFLVRLNRQLNKHKLLKSALTLSTSFDTTRQLRAVRSAQVDFDIASNSVLKLTKSSQRYSALVFLIVVCAVIALGIAITTLFLRHRGGSRTPPFVAALAWLCVALATLAALISSDTCASLSQFHRILRMQAGEIPKDTSLENAMTTNLFINAGVQCPHKLVKTSVPLFDITRNFRLLFDNKLTDVLLRYVYPKSGKLERRNLRHWLIAHLHDAVSCEMMITHVGNINHAFCARKGPMMALFIAWLALILLAASLTIAAFVSQHPKSNIWHAFVPLLPIGSENNHQE